MIESLENNDAVLMMYLADELPAEDRGEVEQMLRADAGMRASLETLTLAWTAAQREIAAADDAVERSLAARQPLVARRISRAMSQEITRRAVQVAPAETPTGLRYPWWAYPAASAAAILLVFLTWWGNRPIGLRDLPAPISSEIAQESHPVRESENIDATQFASDIERVFKTNNDADNAMLALRDDRPAVAPGLESQ